MTRVKKIWFWVVGDTNKGFKVVTRRPRSKHVNEPHPTREGAEKWIALQWLLNS